MNLFNNALTIIKQPTVIKSYRHILLLSHMRANTSLFGHVLGDHKEINGYYEMHIGYYSWKSLIRQKLLFSENHKIKDGSTYFFDKVLHSEHHVSESILNRENVVPIFSLRSPIKTIPSIVKLYEKVDPSHKFSTKQGAMEYYIERISTLSNLAKQVYSYIYIDADAIRDSTEETLASLSELLHLNSELTPKFKQQKLTGKGNTGDHSGHLMAGEIKNSTSQYDNVEFTSGEYELLQEKYSYAKKALISSCKNKILLDY